jgi:tRNA G18 (ribose-2'-O)-methylase SpoU
MDARCTSTGASEFAADTAGSGPNLIDVTIDDVRLDAFRGVRDRELRGTLGLHAIESERVVRRFLTAALRRRSAPIPPVLEPLALLVTPDAEARLRDITTLFPSLTVYRCADERALHEITGYTMHSGAIALGVRHEDGSVDALTACLSRENSPGITRDVVVALDGITQTDNVGAIFRNAASFGARALLLSPRASDPFLRKTLRVSMGRAVAMPWARASSDEWPRALDQLRNKLGYTIVAAEDTPNAVELAQFNPTARTLVVFGAEQDGVSREVLNLADAVVKIPMHGAMSPALEGDPPSLNVSIASAVVLHHLMSSKTTPSAC